MLDGKDLIKLIKASNEMGVKTLSISKDGTINIEFKENVPVQEVYTKEYISNEKEVIEENDKKELEDAIYELDLIDPVKATELFEKGYLKVEDGELVAQL